MASFTTFIIRMVVGGLAVIRSFQKLLRPGAAAEEFEYVGFKRPRTLALATGGTQLVAGLLILFGVLVPLGAGLLLGIALNALMIRGQESGWFSVGVLIDAVLVAGGLILGFISPGAIALERTWDWEVGGGALGVGAIVIGALIAAAGTQLRDTRKVKARRQGTEEEIEPVGSTPPEPLDPEEATDPAATTEGESHADPIRHRNETEGEPDVADRDQREPAEPRRELGDPPVRPLDPETATDPAASTKGESRPDPVGDRERGE